MESKFFTMKDLTLTEFKSLIEQVVDEKIAKETKERPKDLCVKLPLINHLTWVDKNLKKPPKDRVFLSASWLDKWHYVSAYWCTLDHIYIAHHVYDTWHKKPLEYGYWAEINPPE